MTPFLDPRQTAAYEAWVNAGRRGIVVMPTGGRKTRVGIQACLDVPRCTATVIVPTNDLVEQWERELEAAGVEGCCVYTYHFASRHPYRVSRSRVVVYDEVHWLFAPEFSKASTKVENAPARLGLTATLERKDGRHKFAEQLVGPVVYRVEWDEVVEAGVVNDVDHQVIPCVFSDQARATYLALQATYRSFLKKRRIKLGPKGGFARFRGAKGKMAEEAQEAYDECRRLAENHGQKIRMLQKLVFWEDVARKTIIFCASVDQAENLAKLVGGDVIHSKLKGKERAERLQRFADSEDGIIVAPRVLDEGVDIPDAEVGIIYSGTSSRRQAIQRKGRVARESGVQKVLYELYTPRTHEERRVKG